MSVTQTAEVERSAEGVTAADETESVKKVADKVTTIVESTALQTESTTNIPIMIEE